MKKKVRGDGGGCGGGRRKTLEVWMGFRYRKRANWRRTREMKDGCEEEEGRAVWLRRVGKKL